MHIFAASSDRKGKVAAGAVLPRRIGFYHFFVRFRQLELPKSHAKSNGLTTYASYTRLVAHWATSTNGGSWTRSLQGKSTPCADAAAMKSAPHSETELKPCDKFGITTCVARVRYRAASSPHRSFVFGSSLPDTSSAGTPDRTGLASSGDTSPFTHSRQAAANCALGNRRAQCHGRLRLRGPGSYVARLRCTSPRGACQPNKSQIGAAGNLRSAGAIGPRA